jgi:hypothetical protein
MTSICINIQQSCCNKNRQNKLFAFSLLIYIKVSGTTLKLTKMLIDNFQLFNFSK